MLKDQEKGPTSLWYICYLMERFNLIRAHYCNGQGKGTIHVPEIETEKIGNCSIKWFIVKARSNKIRQIFLPFQFKLMIKNT